MSELKVPVTTIDEIIEHPNADRLSIAKIAGWETIIQKGKYQKGQLVVYIPIDCRIPQELEQKLFPPDSKIKLDKRRIKSIKIRGQVSQGMLFAPEEIGLKNYFDGQDVGEKLGIEKWEPPKESVPNKMQVKTAKRHKNKNFKEYTDLANWKWYNRLFQQGEQVVITEKLHGTNFRAGWVKRMPYNWFQKLLIKLGLLSEWQFCWGSRRVQIQSKMFHKGFYSSDVYTKMVKQYNLKEVIPKGYVIYGEIVGDGIQKGYSYGCKEDEHKLYVFEVMKDDKYLDFLANPDVDIQDFDNFIFVTQLPNVPVLYVGPYEDRDLEKYRDGDSLVGDQKVREGCVIKPLIETECQIGRKILKVISPAYQLRNEEEGTDFH